MKKYTIVLTKKQINIIDACLCQIASVLRHFPAYSKKITPKQLDNLRFLIRTQKEKQDPITRQRSKS